MGRKRIHRGKIREPITVSIPRDLIIQFDSTLEDTTSRSRVIERMIRSHVTTQKHSLFDFGLFGYACEECGREWTLNQNVPVSNLMCRLRTGGCGSDKIEYLGNMDLQEEEE